MTLKNIKYVTRHIIEKAIHGTPMTGMDTVNLSSSCKHTTKLACQFKALFTVTQLHLRGVYEN